MENKTKANMALLAGFLGGCSTLEVTYNYDPAADFAALRTYEWVPSEQRRTGDPRVDDNPLLDTRIHQAVDGALGAKGYRIEASGSPDFLVGYYVTLDAKVDVQVLNDYYGYTPGWGWRYRRGDLPVYRVGAPSAFVDEYDEGTLILDFIEPKTRKLIWRGTARDEVNLSAKLETRQKKLSEAVSRMLENFPPP